jgi:hypothetical protein
MSRSGCPLVYASRKARNQARHLLPGQVVENVVAQRIVEGRVRFYPTPVVLGEGWQARVRRIPKKLQRGDGRAWLVTGLEKTTSERR